jgi:ATP-dependent DNA helicase RecG
VNTSAHREVYKQEGCVLAHREYSNAFRARIVIERDRIYAESWNRSNAHGRINPDDFTPLSKDPLIAKLFMNIGRADQLGSGVRNLYTYTKIYSGGEPELIEGDIFKTIIPLTAELTGKADLHGDLRTPTTQDGMQVDTQDERIMSLANFCSIPRARGEMQQHYGVATREYFRKTILRPLLNDGKLRMTIPDKPNSRNQKYIRT